MIPVQWNSDITLLSSRLISDIFPLDIQHSVMMGDYILFKNANQPDTRAIVAHLINSGKIYTPTVIVERNHPAWVTRLPAIFCRNTGERFLGLDECVKFWEERTGESGLADCVRS